MTVSKLSTTELLAYSTVFENVIHTNLEIQREVNNAVSQGFAKPEELEKIMHKSIQAKEEADEVYALIQKELDERMKRDLKIKFGIRRSQSIIREFDEFVRTKNKFLQDEFEESERNKKAERELLGEEAPSLKKVEDDSTE